MDQYPLDVEPDLTRKFEDDEVMEPAFRLVSGASGDEAYRNLYLQTFEKSPDDFGWRSCPTNRWHLLAAIFPDRIVMYPIHTNPHAQRYLSPRHGRFLTLIYEDSQEEEPLPDNAEDATRQIEFRLPHLLFNDACRLGLGLNKDLAAFWQKLLSLQNVNTIAVSVQKPTQIINNVACVNRGDLDLLRRGFNRVQRRRREAINLSQARFVHDEVLTKLDPERFQRIERIGEPIRLVEVTGLSARQSTREARSQRQSSVRTVRRQLETLASEMPRELLELHTEIERVTLAKMIEKYGDMLTKRLDEKHWQRFFEDNIFILSMIFARAIRLLHTQFHAQGPRLDGSGAQIGDFLFAEQGQALAIVEIKKPATKLLLRTPYRNNEVFGPNAELSGAVTQVLHQQSALRSSWLNHRVDPMLKESLPDAIKCVVIAGTMPTDVAQRRSFEIFRNACKDVEVVTFDELLGKLKLLQQHLNPPVIESSDPIPF
jgi:Domain of unknown function (DUF4263)